MERGFFEQLSLEISNMDIANFIVIALLFSVPFYASKKAENIFLRLLYSLLGFYMLFTMRDIRVLYDKEMLIGLGLILPQIRFIIQFIKDTIQTIKMMSANTYYFFVTIYYKVIRFINWVKSSYIMIKIFFEGIGTKKDEQRSRSQKEDKDYHRKFYEEEKKQEKTYEEKQKSYHQEYTHTKQEEPKREDKKEYGEYRQFYSDSAYTVLGVSTDDDFKTIKKAYRNLIRKYHPDLHSEQSEKYTKITQLINGAYNKLEKFHK